MRIVLTWGLVVLTVGAYGQTPGSAIGQIEKEVGAINRATFAVKSYSYSNKCGVVQGILHIYSKHGDIQKITDIGTGDDDRAAGTWNYQYYYKNGVLIFSYRATTSFDNNTGKHITDKKREYFASNRLLKLISGDETSYPQRVRIGDDDIRYQLRGVKHNADVNSIYRCRE